MGFAQLIPGLLNDLAFQCLLRLSSEELLRVQSVSSLWKIAITSDRFYVERRRRAPYPSICVIRRIHSCYEIFDTDVKQLAEPRLLFSCDLHAGEMLFPPGVVFATVGASILAFAPGSQVQKFSLLTRRWMPVSKTMPPQCKLLVTTLGKYVVVLACKHDDNDTDDGDDDDYSYHGRGHDVDDGVCTMYEVFDSHDNQWVSLGGLPDEFYGLHCVTWQGIVYVRGKVNAQRVSVYALDLGKRRWEENVLMTEWLKSVLHESKVITKSDAILMASWHANNTVLFQHQQPGVFDRWMNVTKVSVKPLGNFFVFEHSDQIFLAVSDAGISWRSRTLFYYNGLTILHIPSDQLLMVESIVG